MLEILIPILFNKVYEPYLDTYANNRAAGIIEKGIFSHDGFNKSIMRDGVIVILRKNGTEKTRLDPKTKEIIKAGK